MPANRKDSVKNIASRGCVKCCAYCRVSPHGAALCYGSLGLGIVTVVLYLLASGLTPAADTASGNSAICSTEPPIRIGNFSVSDVYINYLKYTGLVVFLVMVAIIFCCCVTCGLLCGFPRQVKLVAFICFIPTVILFLLYFAWLAVGTFLLTKMEGPRYVNAVCRNILIFMIALWFYFLCLCVFAIILVIWKLCSLKKGEDKKKKDSLLPNIV